MRVGLALVGALLLVIEWRCHRENQRYADGASASVAWRRCRRASFLVGAPLALVAVFVWVPVAGSTVATVIGCPFPAIFLDSRGRDFVGITTPLAALANFYVGFRLPSLPLWLWGPRRRPVASATADSPGPEPRPRS